LTAFFSPLDGKERLRRFVKDRTHWDYKFRVGLFKVCDTDKRLTGHAMQAAY